jgi:hypothetical protein
MFLDRTTEDEFFISLEKNLNTNYSFDKNLQDKRAADVEMYLKHAASALVRAGLRKEAECVVMILDECKGTKPKSKPDSENLLKNLKNTGTLFSSEEFSTDDHDVQTELKKLRSMLK